MRLAIFICPLYRGRQLRHSCIVMVETWNLNAKLGLVALAEGLSFLRVDAQCLRYQPCFTVLHKKKNGYPFHSQANPTQKCC